MDVKVVKDIEKLINWSLPIITKFPRNYRFTLGTRIEERMYSILENSIEAQYSSKKDHLLHKTNLQLEMLRHFLRLAFEQKIVSSRQYEAFSKQIYEIGSQIGGWKKEREKNA